jgi:hypothetical protein
MPKYEVKTTATYTFIVEATDQSEAELYGGDFEEHNWGIEIDNVEATLVEEN